MHVQFQKYVNNIPKKCIICLYILVYLCTKGFKNSPKTKSYNIMHLMHIMFMCTDMIKDNAL